jgi:4-hydroxy-tetrahydrodipicolinate synthase
MTNFHRLIPAGAVPLNEDGSVAISELTGFARWLARQPGVVGMMTNGHTGEVFSFTPRERAEIKRIVAQAVDGRCPVVSSIVCEGIRDAVEQAGWAKDAGAQALDIMPPHHWLRFGFRSTQVNLARSASNSDEKEAFVYAGYTCTISGNPLESPMALK